MRDEHYIDMINPLMINSGAAIEEQRKKIERIEKGRAEEVARAITKSPLFVELQTQTKLNQITIIQQEKQIQELQSQNHKLEEQVKLLKETNEASRKQARRSFIGFVISTVIALASLVVAIIF